MDFRKGIRSVKASGPSIFIAFLSAFAANDFQATNRFSGDADAHIKEVIRRRAG